MRWSKASLDLALRRIRYVVFWVYVSHQIDTAYAYTIEPGTPFMNLYVPHIPCLSAITVVTEGMPYSTTPQLVGSRNHSVPNRADAYLVYSTIGPVDARENYTRDAMDTAWVYCSMFDTKSSTCLAPAFTPHIHSLRLAPFNPRFCNSVGISERTHIFTLYDCEDTVVDVFHIRFDHSSTRYCHVYAGYKDTMLDPLVGALTTFFIGIAVLLLILVGMKQYFCKHIDFDIQ